MPENFPQNEELKPEQILDKKIEEGILLAEKEALERAEKLMRIQELEKESRLREEASRVCGLILDGQFDLAASRIIDFSIPFELYKEGLTSAFENWTRWEFGGEFNGRKMAEEFLNQFPIPPDQVESIFKGAIYLSIERGDFGYAEDLAEKLELGPNFFKTEEVISKGKECILNLVGRRDIYTANSVAEFLEIDKKFFKSPEFLKEAEKGLEYIFAVDGFNDAKYFIELFNLPDDLVARTVNIYFSNKFGMEMSSLRDHSLEVMRRTAGIFKVDLTRFQPVVLENIPSLLLNRRFGFAMGLADLVGIRGEEFMEMGKDFINKEVDEICGEKIVDSRRIVSVFQFAKEIDFSESDLTNRLKPALISLYEKGRFDILYEVSRSVDLKSDFIASPEFEEVQLRSLISFIGDRIGFRNINVAIRSGLVSERVLKSPEFTNAVISAFESHLDKADWDTSLEFYGAFSFLHETSYLAGRGSEKISAALKKCIDFSDHSSFKRFVKEFKVSNEFVVDAVRSKMIGLVQSNDFSGLSHWFLELRGFGVGEDLIVDSPGVREAFERHLINSFETGAWNLERLSKVFPVLFKMVSASPLLQEKALEKVLSSMAVGSTGEALGIKEMFSIPDSVFETAEAKEAVFLGFLENLEGHVFEEAFEVAERFKIFDGFLDWEKHISRIRDMIKDLLDNGYGDQIQRLKEEVLFVSSVLAKVDFQKNFKNCFDRLIDDESLEEAGRFAKSFPLDRGFVDKLVGKKIEGLLVQDYVYDAIFAKAIDWIENFSYPRPELMKICEAAFSRIVDKGDIDKVIQFHSFFNDYVPELFTKPKFAKKAASLIADVLNEQSSTETALNLKNVFSLDSKALAGRKVQAAVKEQVIYEIESEDPKLGIQLISEFDVPDSFRFSARMQKLAERRLIGDALGNVIKNAVDLCKFFKIPQARIDLIDEEFAKAAATRVPLTGNIFTKDDFGLYWVGEFPGLLPKFTKAARDLAYRQFEVNRETREAFAANLGVFKNLQADWAYKLCSDGYFREVFENIDSFSGLDGLKMLEIFREKDIALAAKYNSDFLRNKDRALEAAHDVFGAFLTDESFEVVKLIQEGVLDDERVKKVGVRTGGEAGLLELRKRMNMFRKEVFKEDFNPETILESPLYGSYFKSLVRYEDSQWGRRDDANFTNMIRNYENSREQGVEPMPGYFEPSGEIRVARVSRKEQEEFKYSESFSERYKVLMGSLGESIGLLESKKPLSETVVSISEKRDGVLRVLKQKLGSLDNPKASEHLTKRIQALEGVRLRSVRDFETNFEILAQFDEFHDDLRKVIFFKALHDFPDRRDRARQLSHDKQPTFDDVVWAIDFIDHITNQEVWSKYFKNKGSMEAFKKLTNIRSFQEEMARAQNQSLKGTVPFEFVPTRGILMEFSGHIADACWANKYTSIAKEFPNFTALTMVQNRGTKNERIVGSCLVIETKTSRGEPIMVIRGLNPIENVINELSVESFYKALEGYMKRTARKAGKRFGMTTGGERGEYSTNRPAVFEFIAKNLRPKLPKVRLASSRDTEFNGHDIVNGVSLVT